jgi:hypothetical protein
MKAKTMNEDELVLVKTVTMQHLFHPDGRWFVRGNMVDEHGTLRKGKLIEVVQE